MAAVCSVVAVSEGRRVWRGRGREKRRMVVARSGGGVHERRSRGHRVQLLQ